MRTISWTASRIAAVLVAVVVEQRYLRCVGRAQLRRHSPSPAAADVACICRRAMATPSPQATPERAAAAAERQLSDAAAAFARRALGLRILGPDKTPSSATGGRIDTPATADTDTDHQDDAETDAEHDRARDNEHGRGLLEPERAVRLRGGGASADADVEPTVCGRTDTEGETHSVCSADCTCAAHDSAGQLQVMQHPERGRGLSSPRGGGGMCLARERLISRAVHPLFSASLSMSIDSGTDEDHSGVSSDNIGASVVRSRGLDIHAAAVGRAGLPGRAGSRASASLQFAPATNGPLHLRPPLAAYQAAGGNTGHAVTATAQNALNVDVGDRCRMSSAETQAGGACTGACSCACASRATGSGSAPNDASCSPACRCCSHGAHGACTNAACSCAALTCTRAAAAGTIIAARLAGSRFSSSAVPLALVGPPAASAHQTRGKELGGEHCLGHAAALAVSVDHGVGSALHSDSEPPSIDASALPAPTPGAAAPASRDGEASAGASLTPAQSPPHNSLAAQTHAPTTSTTPAATTGAGAAPTTVASATTVGTIPGNTTLLRPRASVEIDGETFFMPDHFGIVEDGVYRSAFPSPACYSFLARLRLRTIVNLLEKLPDEYVAFMSAQGIKYVHSAVKGNKAHCEEMDRGVVAAAIGVIIDTANHPVLIHCRSGKHRTGALVGCVRMVSTLRRREAVLHCSRLLSWARR